MTSLSGSDGAELPESRILVLGGLFFIALVLVLTVIGVWGISDVHQEYRKLLAQDAPVLLQSTGISFFYLCFPGLIGLFWIGVSALIAGIRQSSDSPRRRRHMKIASYLIVVGVVAMFAGRYIGNSYWSEIFRDAGYVSCENSFGITGKWAQVVWVRDKGYCADEEVRRLFSSYEYSLKDVNEYLAQKESS